MYNNSVYALSKQNSILQKFILERLPKNTDVIIGTLSSGQETCVNSGRYERKLILIGSLEEYLWVRGTSNL